MKIRRFAEEDASAVSELIIKTIRISNVKDYPADLMEELVSTETPQKIMDRASWTHTYVVEDEGRIIATGAIGPYWGKEDESSLFTIFVLPEYQGKGVGRLIMDTLEKDEYALRAKRIEIPASITGLPFYRKMGYEYKDGNDRIDEEHLCRLEKKKDIEPYLTTDRLILRRWKESDAEDMFELCKDPDIGPIAGWPPHKDVDESRNVINNVLQGKEAYAICLRGTAAPVGCIELRLGTSDLAHGDDECELGFWLGKPYWGQGIMPEAAKELIRHGFEDLGMTKIWAGYYDGNAKSKRCQEKIGFKYQWTSDDVDVHLMHEKRKGHVNLITIEDWKGEHGNG